MTEMPILVWDGGKRSETSSTKWPALRQDLKDKSPDKEEGKSGPGSRLRRGKEHVTSGKLRKRVGQKVRNESFDLETLTVCKKILEQVTSKCFTFTLFLVQDMLHSI